MTNKQGVSKTKFIASMTARLEKEFESPCPPVEIVANRYMGITTADTAKRYASEQKYPFPTFQTGIGQKGSKRVNLEDFAEYLYKQWKIGKKDYEALNS